MMVTMTRQKKLDELTMRSIAFKLMGVGWYVAFCLGAGLGGGWLIDNQLGTFPVFALVLLTLGLFVAFYGIWRMIRPLVKQAEEQAKANREKENG